MFLNDLLEKYNRIVIYGIGNKSKRLIELEADKLANKVSCFVVSDEYMNDTSFLGKPVLPFSSYHHDLNEIILVAVHESNKDSIIKEIIRQSYDYYYVTETDLRSLYIERHPFTSESFLKSTNPVSRVFGLDRGNAIDRYYIDSFIRKESKKIKGVKRVLEVGETVYSDVVFPGIEHSILDYSKGMDLTRVETLAKEFFDVFICTQTLHCVYNITDAIKGCRYLLKPGGVLLATVAGNISQVSQYDMDRWGDYWRFTWKSIGLLMKEVFGECVSVHPYGNSMAATAFIQGLCVEEVDKSLLDECDSDYSIVIGIVAKKGTSSEI